jgi:hypothetical protein
VKVSLPAANGARFNVTVPFFKVPVDVAVVGTIVSPDALAEHPVGFPKAQFRTSKDAYVTVTSPVGTPAPLLGVTVTVTGVLTTSDVLATVIFVNDPARAAPAPVVSITTGEFTALLVIPICPVRVPCSPGPGFRVISTWQVPPAASGLSAIQVPSAAV